MFFLIGLAVGFGMLAPFVALVAIGGSSYGRGSPCTDQE